ncbi:MAG: hypothetical protein V1740_06580 [Candidatus Woesearchaeota archaeon]
MEFWNSALTEKSWKILKDLKKAKFDFILIGGWAAYLWTNIHKSKDIDIVIKEFNDLNVLKKEHDIVKNDNLRKYEIKIEEIDIDVYVPFYSRLSIPVDEIRNHTTIIQNIEVVKPEILLILKQGAESDREHSVKGQKDRVDIMTLLCRIEINFKEYIKLIKRYKIENYYDRLKNIINTFTEINYLDLNPREFRLKKKELLGKLRKC